MALYNADLKPLVPGTFTRSYEHATKLFLADNFRLTPKQSFLYYVVFNFNPGFSSSVFGDILSFVNKYQSFEIGMLVKRADLPKFQINTKTVNSYNRKNILQTSLTYETSNIVFHDDAADVITNFWNDYYTFYFRDSDYDINQYTNQYRYNLRTQTGWGFMPRNQAIANFFTSIRIFSLHNKRFTEHMLINPVITAWKHGEVNSNESTQLLESTMTVAYETVKYFTGYVNPVNVDGFSLLHYDNTPSPISKSTTNIYTDAGVLGALDSVAKDLKKPDGANGAGGIVSDLLSMYRAYKNIKGTNLRNAVGTTVAQIGAGLLNQVLNGIDEFVFPTETQDNNGIIGTLLNQVSNPTSLLGSVTGGAVSFNYGRAVQSNGSNRNQSNAAVTRGYSRNPAGAGSVNPRVTDVLGDSGGLINVDGSLQTPTGTNTGFYLDEFGNPVAEFTTNNTDGKYDPTDPTANLLYIETTYDTEGTATVLMTYADGTLRREDEDGNLLEITPGNIKNNIIDVNPTSSAVRAASGQIINNSGIQNSRSGSNTRVVGGASSARVRSTTGRTGPINRNTRTGGMGGGIADNNTNNIISGAAGALAGTAAAVGINRLLSNTGLNSSPIGRVISRSISAAGGAAFGKVVNGVVKNITNGATGSVSQLIDSASGRIRNVLGSWTGTGGYDPSKPLDNIISQTKDGLGGTVYTYKDGTVRTIDAEGNQTITGVGSDATGINDWNTAIAGQNTDITGIGADTSEILYDANGNVIYSGWGESIDDGWGTVIGESDLSLDIGFIDEGEDILDWFL